MNTASPVLKSRRERKNVGGEIEKEKERERDGENRQS